MAWIEPWPGPASGRALHEHRIGSETRAATVRVTALHVDPRGRLWVGTRGAGLYRSDDPAAERPRFTAYTVANGLSSGTVWCLTDDGAGKLYAGTARGVDRLEPESGQFKHFSVADGLAGSEVIAAFRDRDGALWFGTFKGISRLTRASGCRARTAHRLDWRTAHSRRGPAARAPGPVRTSRCAISRHIRIRSRSTTSASLPHPESCSRISTNSKDTDSAWTAPTPERTVNYAELAPGSYRFLVRAVNADGQASQAPASVTFTILPPVWKRGWFLGTLALLAIASGYAVHKSRVTRLLEMERLRTRIASDLHDDVGSSLTQISILSEIVRTHLADPDAHDRRPAVAHRHAVEGIGRFDERHRLGHRSGSGHAGPLASAHAARRQ